MAVFAYEDVDAWVEIQDMFIQIAFEILDVYAVDLHFFYFEILANYNF